MDEVELELARRRQPISFGLFEQQPVTRTTDPETSHKAERQHAPKRETQAIKILRAYAYFGPMTDEQAAERAKIVGGWKRCADLRNAGLIAPTDRTAQTSMGAEARVCAITPKGEAILEAREPMRGNPQPARLGRSAI